MVAGLHASHVLQCCSGPSRCGHMVVRGVLSCRLPACRLLALPLGLGDFRFGFTYLASVPGIGPHADPAYKVAEQPV